MSAVVGQDWRPKTLRELYLQYQAVLLESWHHTAHIKSCFATKKTSYEKLHPYVGGASLRRGAVVKPISIFSRPDTFNGERVSIMREMRRV